MTNDVSDGQGLVILGHGSRYQAGLSVIIETTARYQKLHPKKRVVYAFIELAEPRLEKSVELLISEGVKQIIVVPLFLSFGHHIARDLPTRMEALAEKYHDVNFITTEPIGADPLLCDIIQARIDANL